MKRFAKTLDECDADTRMRILNWCETRRAQEISAKPAKAPEQTEAFE
jgi:hypothetical protein